MSLARVTAWTLLAAAGFALLAPRAVAQNPLPKKPNTSEVEALRDAPIGGIPADKLKDARAALKTFAQYYTDVIAHPDVYKAPQELRDPKLPPLPTFDNLATELSKYTSPPKTNREPAAYLREFGFAFNEALKPLLVPNIEKPVEIIVRVNAARMLAHVARTGAPAHFPTVTSLLADPKTPTAVKVYLFQAAGALLAAPDITELKIRRHVALPVEVAKLVKTLQDCINDPGLIIEGASVTKPETMTEEQQAVIGYVRREAVRALGKVKFVRIPIPGPDGKPVLTPTPRDYHYPAYTLVRVAMSDPNLVPAPRSAEVADAVIGLCNMAPFEEQVKGGFRLVKEFNHDVAIEAVTAGLVTFAKPRAANPADNSVRWQWYAAELAGALRDWRLLFDPEYEPLLFVASKFNPATVPPGVDVLNNEVVPDVLAPMQKVDVTVQVKIVQLQKRFADLRAREKRNTLLFSNVPETTIEFPPPKKAAPPEKKDPPPKDVPKAKEPEKKDPPKK